VISLEALGPQSCVPDDDATSCSEIHVVGSEGDTYSAMDVKGHTRACL
jgi:hypothetical protein